MAAELHPAVDYQSVIPDSHTENYSDRLLVLKPSSLKEDYRHEEFQYFFAESGFGCDPEKLGTKVFGRFLIDGEESAFRRYDFYGIADEEKLPGWAKEKLMQLTQHDTVTAAGPEISM
jgi:hypothetical protein